MLWCDICDEILKEQGALLFSPPTACQVIKFHVCVKCWKKLARKFKLTVKP